MDNSEVVATAGIIAMIAEGDGSTVSTTTGQSAPIVSAVEVKLPCDAQSDMPCHLVDIETDVAGVVSDIISSAADSATCTTAVVTSVASNTYDCRSTPVCAATVSTSADNAVDNMQLEEVQVNGN